MKYEFEVQYLKGALTVAEQNMHREISPGVIAYFSSFRPESNSGSDFSLEKWNNGKLTYKLISSGATIHPETQVWTIEKVQIRTFHEDGTESLVLKDKLDTLLNISDRVFALRAEIAGAMTWTELNQFIDDQLKPTLTAGMLWQGKCAQKCTQQQNRLVIRGGSTIPLLLQTP